MSPWFQGPVFSQEGSLNKNHHFFWGLMLLFRGVSHPKYFSRLCINGTIQLSPTNKSCITRFPVCWMALPDFFFGQIQTSPIWDLRSPRKRPHFFGRILLSGVSHGNPWRKTRLSDFAGWSNKSPQEGRISACPNLKKRDLLGKKDVTLTEKYPRNPFLYRFFLGNGFYHGSLPGGDTWHQSMHAMLATS